MIEFGQYIYGYSSYYYSFTICVYLKFFVIKCWRKYAQVAKDDVKMKPDRMPFKKRTFYQMYQNLKLNLLDKIFETENMIKMNSLIEGLKDKIKEIESRAKNKNMESERE